MSSPRRLTLRLDLDLACDPIEGELWEPTGLRLAFSGWLGLADALEQASDRERHGDSTATLSSTEPPKESSDLI